MLQHELVSFNLGFQALSPESKPYLDPRKPTFFKDLYTELRMRNPKEVGYLGLRCTLNPKP